MPTQIQITGLNELLAHMHEAPEVVKEEIEAAVTTSLLSLIPDLARYPPQRPNSTYRRTGTLGREWTVSHPLFTLGGNSFQGSIGNNTPYAGYVEGGINDVPHQAYFNVGYWQTTDEVVAGHQGEIQALFDAAGKRIVDRL